MPVLSLTGWVERVVFSRVWESRTGRVGPWPHYLAAEDLEGLCESRRAGGHVEDLNIPVIRKEKFNPSPG
jgi:hypothetical protein